MFSALHALDASKVERTAERARELLEQSEAGLERRRNELAARRRAVWPIAAFFAGLAALFALKLRTL
jgi:hypothetical protein